jgi:hypothetical protein
MSAAHALRVWPAEARTLLPGLLVCAVVAAIAGIGLKTRLKALVSVGFKPGFGGWRDRISGRSGLGVTEDRDGGLKLSHLPATHVPKCQVNVPDS